MSVRGWPPTVSVRVADESSAKLGVLLVAVNGPSVAGDVGTVSTTPASGTGLGMVTVKLSVPVDSVAGVASVASIWAVTDPCSCGEMAAAAEANAAGRVTEVWYPLRL